MSRVGKSLEIENSSNTNFEKDKPSRTEVGLSEVSA
jgi:hypothetical protein